MRLVIICFWLIVSMCSAAYAQHDTVGTAQAINPTPLKSPLADSIARDSVTKLNRQQFLANSIAMKYLQPDSLRENLFVTQIFKDNLSYLYPASFAPATPKVVSKSGLPRKMHDPWVIAIIIGLLIYTALLNVFLGNDVKIVIQSFYSKQALSHLDKEGGLVNSWAFIGLFILFSLAFGLILYQLTEYYNIYFSIDGFQLFIAFSILVGLLFALKFMVLKVLGFIFDVNGIVSQYIAILNLTYFNIAFVLLSATICFSLLSSRFVPILLILLVGVIMVIFAWQYLRNSVSIISNFRFHKFYLFIYLCALEICPILILIKALNI